MEIRYHDTKEFETMELQELFLSIGWDSGNYREELQLALKNSHRVFSAWHEERLVGLINALSDGVMTAYFHYMLIHPQYRRLGIGKKLLGLMLEEYRAPAIRVLIAYEDVVDFYRKCGFRDGQGNTAMFLTKIDSVNRTS